MARQTSKDRPIIEYRSPGMPEGNIDDIPRVKPARPLSRLETACLVSAGACVGLFVPAGIAVMLAAGQFSGAADFIRWMYVLLALISSAIAIECLVRADEGLRSRIIGACGAIATLLGIFAFLFLAQAHHHSTV